MIYQRCGYIKTTWSATLKKSEYNFVQKNGRMPIPLSVQNNKLYPTNEASISLQDLPPCE